MLALSPEYSKASLGGLFGGHDAQMSLFFPSSREFHVELTRLYDFINPTGAALWNLRWQVAGYVAERPEAKQPELESRFVAGSGIGSVNLKRHCVETSWDDQLEMLGTLALFQAVGLFEGWVDSLPLGPKDRRQRLMFPSPGAPGASTGVPEFILSRGSSSRMKLAYGASLQTSKSCMPERLNDLLVTFRCFKEVRNVCAHSGRIASSLVVRNTAAAASVCHGFGQGPKPLKLPTVTLDEPIGFGMLEAKAACALLLKLVTTLDYELAKTVDGERLLVAEWKRRIGRQQVSANPSKRGARLRLLSKRAGLPEVADAQALYEILRDSYLVL